MPGHNGLFARQLPIASSYFEYLDIYPFLNKLPVFASCSNPVIGPCSDHAPTMLTEIYVEALLVDEDLADQVWEAWDAGILTDDLAASSWWNIASVVVGKMAGRIRPLTMDICDS